MIIIIILLLLGGGFIVFGSGMFSGGENYGQGASTLTPYYIYLKKHCYEDLSQDERFKDLGKWTVYDHESFKLETACKREDVENKLRDTLGLTGDDIKVVGRLDLYTPIKFR